VIEGLLIFPRSGATRPDLTPPGRSYRYVVVSKVFILVYDSNGTGIFIVRILHGAQHLARELNGDDESEGD